MSYRNLLTFASAMILGVMANNNAFAADKKNFQVSYIDVEALSPDEPKECEGVVSLQDTLERAYMQNAELDAARAGLRATDEDVSQANADWRPSISVTGEHTFSRVAGGKAQPPGTLAPKPRRRGTDTQYTARIDQNLYNGGRTEANIGRRESEVLGGRANLLTTEQNTLLTAVQDHTEILKNAAILRYQQRRETFYKGLFDRAEVRYEVGEGSRTDVEDARGQYEGARAEVSTALGNLETANASYMRDMGSPPGRLAAAKVLLTLPKTYEEALEIAKAHNPAILSARYSLEAAQYILNFERGALLPTVGISGSVGNRRQGPTARAGAFGPASETTSLAFNTNVTVPIYQQGLPNSRIRQAFQTIAQQKVQLVNSQRTVVQQTDEAWTQLIAARESVRGFLAQVRAQELAVEGALEEYDAGTKTMLDVQQIEQNLIEAQIQLANAQQRLIVTAYQVLAAMGRLTARELKLNVKYYDPDAYYNEYKNAWIQFWQGEDLRYVKDGEYEQ